MKKYPVSLIQKCSYCGSFARGPGGYRDYICESGRFLNSGIPGICSSCAEYFETKYANVEVLKCETCGDSFRRSETSAIKKVLRFMSEYEWPIKLVLYFETCRKPECLFAVKWQRELTAKRDGLKLFKKQLDSEMKQLRKAIKGE